MAQEVQIALIGAVVSICATLCTFILQLFLIKRQTEASKERRETSRKIDYNTEITDQSARQLDFVAKKVNGAADEAQEKIRCLEAKLAQAKQDAEVLAKAKILNDKKE